MAVTYSQNGVIVKPTGFDVIGGKKYKTVQMPDGKIWLAENLDFKFCNIGGSGGTPSTPYAWYYNNDESTYGWNGYKCGLLYDWYAAKVLNDNRSELCPGWHVPTTTEFNTLATACGGAAIAGAKLKALDGSAGTGFPSGWNGTDDYGFGALPTGEFHGAFGSDTYTFFWTLTERCAFLLVNNSGEFGSYAQYPSSNGFSIRLVRDAT